MKPPQNTEWMLLDFMASCTQVAHIVQTEKVKKQLDYHLGL